MYMNGVCVTWNQYRANSQNGVLKKTWTEHFGWQTDAAESLLIKKWFLGDGKDDICVQWIRVGKTMLNRMGRVKKEKDKTKKKIGDDYNCQ